MIDGQRELASVGKVFGEHGLEITTPISGSRGQWCSADPEMRRRMTPIDVVFYAKDKVWHSFGSKPELFV